MGRNIPIKLVVVILLLGIICFFYYRYGLSPQLVQLRDLRDQVDTGGHEAFHTQGSPAPARGIRAGRTSPIRSGLTSLRRLRPLLLTRKNTHASFSTFRRLARRAALPIPASRSRTPQWVRECCCSTGRDESCQDRRCHDKLHGQGLLDHATVPGDVPHEVQICHGLLEPDCLTQRPRTGRPGQSIHVLDDCLDGPEP